MRNELFEVDLNNEQERYFDVNLYQKGYTKGRVDPPVKLEMVRCTKEHWGLN